MATKAVKLPSGSWRVRAQADAGDGKQHYKSFTAETRKEAEYLAAQYALTRREARKPAAITVGQAIDRYIDARASILSPSTIVSYRAKRRNNLQGLMDIPIGSLTVQQVQRAINADAARVSPKTMRCAYGIVTAALAEYLPDLSLRGVNLPKPVRHEIYVPDDTGVEALVKHADGHLLMAVLLAAFGGLRRSEIGALTLGDLDADASTVSISKAVVRADSGSWVVKPPKSFAGTRVVSLPPHVMQTILDLADHTKPYIVGIRPDGITKRFVALRDAVGLKCRFHDLRHYTASIMLALGVPDKYAMEIMGHATPGMLKAVYQHTFRDKRKEVDAKITSYFEKYDTKYDTRK